MSTARTSGGGSVGLTWLIIVGVIAFTLMAVSFALAPLSVRSRDADVFSTSAFGHAAFAALLEQAGYTVRTNRQVPVDTTGGISLYVAIEPRSVSELEAQVATLPANTPMLIVLPFRNPPNWLFGQRVPPFRSFVPLDTATSIGRVAIPGISVERTGPEIPGPPMFAGPDQWTAAWERRAAAIAATDQVLAPGTGISGFSVLAGTPEAPIAARVRGGPRLLLANPDLIANHGLHEPEVAATVLGLVNAVVGASGTVVIDEVVHGHELPPDPWRALLTPPLLAATLTAVLAAVLLAWAGSVRFGRPQPEPPALAPGARTLIETAASPMTPDEHGTAILDRYVDIQAADVARRFKPGAETQSRDATDVWLDQLASARGASHRISELRPQDRLRAAAIMTRAPPRSPLDSGDPAWTSLTSAHCATVSSRASAVSWSGRSRRST